MPLYALPPFSMVLCGLAAYVPGGARWRMVAEGLVAFLVVGLAWIWVRMNRHALSRITPDSEMASELEAPTPGAQKTAPRVSHVALRRKSADG